MDQYPSNYTLVQQEAECIAEQENPPWYQTMLAYERGDSNRTGLYECATFTGLFTGPNQVYAYRSPDRYYTPAIMVTRGTNEMYIYGGSNAAADPIPISSYLARVEPGTLKELWRTVLINTNISDPWTGVGGLESLGGNLFAVTNFYLYKLNGTTGEVEGVLTLPTGAGLPNNSYFNGMGGWPDGTLVMKNLARAPGCTLQGFFALANCPSLEDTPPSVSVFAVSQANASKLTRIEPMPLEPGQVSYIPSLPAFDPENNRIYAMDPGPGKVAAVNVDQETGNMTLAWSVDEKTLEWMVLIGPADQRVFVGTNPLTNVTYPLDYNVGPQGANYKEQIQWRDANTGKLLAASDYFSPMINGFQMWPSYGGIIYEGLNEGNVMVLKVLPATNATSTANMTSTTTTAATGQNTTSAAG